MANISIIVKNLLSGGAEKQSVLLANAISDCHNVHYIILNGDNINPKYIDLINQKNIKLHILNCAKKDRIKRLRNIFKEEDIDIAFPYLTGANLSASIASLHLKTKVFTSLRLIRLSPPKHFIDALLNNFLAEGTISNSFDARNHFAKTGFRRSRIQVIPNCFANIAEKSPKRTPDIPTIISVGRFVDQKDYKTAIKAISLLKQNTRDFRYIIVGYGQLENKIRGWAAEYGVSDLTELKIDPSNIAELLDSADVYLSSSLFEGTSNSIMEAMNAALPVVATNVGDNACLIQNGFGGYIIRPKCPKDISDALLDLLQNPSLREKMGIYNLKRLKDCYSVEKFRESYLSLIDQTIKKAHT